MKKEEHDAIINELKEQFSIEEEVKFNEFNVSDKLQENTSLKFKYQEFFEREKNIHNELLKKYDILVGQRFDFYRFEYDRNLTKTEVEQYYLPKDKKILALKRLLEKQETKVKFFEICFKAIDNLYWRIKYWIDNEKI